mmetsp:Transcript_16166/g.30068  ORF Transcript_16166/g.30068 Transcript_16166/m.30068 type:complete len:229 (-) Transcript_16166:34-720(-)
MYGQGQNCGACGICATLAIMTLVAVMFLAGKLDASQMTLFMVSMPSTASQSPVVSPKEILTGVQPKHQIGVPVINRIGEPVLNTEPSQQIKDVLKKYEVCDSYCCRRDMLARAVAAAALTVGAPALAAKATEVVAGTDANPLSFAPQDITICKGDAVVWKGLRGLPHNIIFADKGVPKGVDALALSTVDDLENEGQTYKATFTIPGTYDYFCIPHLTAGMIGKITVSS